MFYCIIVWVMGNKCGDPALVYGIFYIPGNRSFERKNTAQDLEGGILVTGKT